MPSKEQTLFAHWGIIEAMINNIKDHAKGSEFDHLKDILSKFSVGASLIRFQMQAALDDM